MAFLFLFTLLTLFMTATLLRTNKQYHPKYMSALESLERTTANNEQLLYGGGADLLPKGSISGEKVMAKKDRMTRGRVWRNVVPGQLGGADKPFLLNMAGWNNDGCLRVGKEEDEFSDEPLEPEPDEDLADEGTEDAGDDADPAEAVIAEPESSHGIKKGDIVYAFKEFPIRSLSEQQKAHYFGSLSEDENFANKDTRGFCRVPFAYLGKFEVVDAQPNGIAAKLQGVPDQAQIAQFTQKGPWVLYERLPMDVAGLFGDMDAAKISQIIPLEFFAKTGLNLDPQIYQAMVQEYARDGKAFQGQANQIDPMRLKVQVKFTKSHSQPVDLQVEGELPPADSPFNTEGLAQISSLLQGGEGDEKGLTTFEEGELAFFDKESADKLVRLGVAEILNESPLYSRPLRAFEFSIDDYQKRFDEVANQVRDVNSRVDALTTSLKSLQDQIDAQARELQKLQDDKQGFETEMQQLDKYRQELRQRREQLEGEVNGLTGGGLATR